MAKGGGKRRTYVRDGNGRFASTPGSAAKKAAKSTSGRKGTLGARTGLKGSKAKLKAKDKAKDKADQTLQNTLSTRAQKGAVTRGSRKLAAAKVAAQTRIGGARKGVIGKPRGLKARPALKPSLLAGAATTLQQSLSKAKTKSDEAKARIAYKRIVRQELKNNPQNVLASNVPKQKRLPDQDSRMSKSKVRTVGNSKERVQKRTTRKLYQAERALDRTLNMKNRGLLVQASTYEKQLRSALTLGSASKYLKTGQLPRGNNSIAEKRKMADAMERLTQKNKQRARERAARESKGLKSQGIAARSDAKPKLSPKIDMKQAINKATQLRNKAKQVSKRAESMMGGGRKDGAIINMSLNSRTRQSTVNRGITGSRLAAQAEALNNKAGRVLDRAIASRKKAEREALKPAKKQRSAESLRISRAKQVEKRRSINITNPAGWREDAAAKMAANAARTQKRALDFYKQKGRAPKTPVPAPNSPTRTKGSRTALPRTPGTVAKPKGLKRMVNPKPAISPTATGRQKPLKNISSALKNNLKAFAGLPVEVRSRKRAAAAQRERSRQTYEFARGSKNWKNNTSASGLVVKKTKVNQGNLLTGRTEKVTARTQVEWAPSKIGASQASIRRQARRDRAEKRFNELIAQQKALPRIRKGNAGSLIGQRLSVVGRALREYDMGTGRRSPRRKTGRFWIKP